MYHLTNKEKEEITNLNFAVQINVVIKIQRVSEYNNIKAKYFKRYF